MDDPAVANPGWMDARSAYDIAVPAAEVDARKHAGPVAETRRTTGDDRSRRSALCPSKINGLDPHVMPVWTPYATPPLLRLSDPVVQLASRRPLG
jgi:hypothetical protein